MVKKKGIKSGTGMVHAMGAVHYLHNTSRRIGKARHAALCGQTNDWGSQYHDWPETDEPITCKKCLNILGEYVIKRKKPVKLVLLLSPYTHEKKMVMRGRVYEAECHVAKLLNEGVQVISLITAYHHMFERHNIDPTYDFWKDFCHMMIKKADKIMLLPLPGWKDSDGLADELALCKKLYKTVHKLKP